jgi:hypothetical protein
MTSATVTNLVKINFYGAPANKKERAAREELAATIEQAIHAYMCTDGSADVMKITLYPLTASEQAELDAA